MGYFHKANDKNTSIVRVDNKFGTNKKQSDAGRTLEVETSLQQLLALNKENSGTQAGTNYWMMTGICVEADVDSLQLIFVCDAIAMAAGRVVFVSSFQRFSIAFILTINSRFPPRRLTHFSSSICNSTIETSPDSNPLPAFVRMRAPLGAPREMYIYKFLSRHNI